MKKAAVCILSIMMVFAMLADCHAESNINGLHDYIFNMWLDETLFWKKTYFAEHNTFIREQIEPYPENACWVIFVPGENMVRLCGERNNGEWVSTAWRNFTLEKMLELCMSMCMTWETYDAMGTFGIMFWYPDESMRRYITNANQAAAYLELYKETYNMKD